jgi:hypothetical protein
METLWWLLGYNEEAVLPAPHQVKHRNEVLKDIKEGRNSPLKPVKKPLKKRGKKSFSKVWNLPASKNFVIDDKED